MKPLRPPVEVLLSAYVHGKTHRRIKVVSRDFWEEMTPRERREHLDGFAEEYSHGEYVYEWSIENPADRASVAQEEPPEVRPVRVHLRVSLWGNSYRSTIEVPRGKWESMTPRERHDYLWRRTEECSREYINYEWSISDPDDRASVLEQGDPS